MANPFNLSFHPTEIPMGITHYSNFLPSIVDLNEIEQVTQLCKIYRDEHLDFEPNYKLFFHAKNSQKSRSLREEGNKLFQKKSFSDALMKFNQSVLHAPYKNNTSQDEPLMAYALANRYKKCTTVTVISARSDSFLNSEIDDLSVIIFKRKTPKIQKLINYNCDQTFFYSDQLCYFTPNSIVCA